MEAIGAAASVMAIVEIVGRVSASAASFMRDIKDARKDMIEVRKDMAHLSTVLTIIDEDLGYHGQGSFPQHIVDIAHSCGAVVLEIETVLRESRSSIAWATSGKTKVDGLRARLETCKLSFGLALEFQTVVVVHDIKVDSTQILGDVSALRSDMALLLEKVNNIERQATEVQTSANDTNSPDGVDFDRFLNDCRSDAQTVLDNIEDQQDQEFEGSPSPTVLDNIEDQEYQEFEGSPSPTVQGTAEIRPELTQSSPSAKILFRNSLGYARKIPLEQCRTWSQMEKVIKRSYSEDPTAAEQIQNRQYSIFHNREVIEPASWAEWVQPGVSVDLYLWDEFIKLEDGSGEEFYIPYIWVETWEGIEDWLHENFDDDEGIGPALQQGHYYLIGPDDTYIQHTTWEQLVKPGMSITLSLRPMGEIQPASDQAGPREGRRKKKRSSSARKRELSFFSG